MTEERALQSLERLDAAARCKASPRELDSIFDALVEAYASLSEGARKRVRQVYNTCSCWGTSDFWMENPSHILRFREHGRIEDLRRALAHYSLSDGYPDARDAIVGMSDLMAYADRHGVDPGPVFSEIAVISNPDGTWGLQKYMQDTRYESG